MNSSIARFRSAAVASDAVSLPLCGILIFASSLEVVGSLPIAG